MHPIIIFSLLLPTLAIAQSKIRFGPYYSLGSTKSYIVDAETTLYPGRPPTPQQDRLVLWPGMGTDSGNLIQAIVGSFNRERTQCKGKEGQWCVFTSVLQSYQRHGDNNIPMDSGKAVTIRYVYDEGTKKTTQTMKVDGKVVSTLVLASGKAKGWGTAVECQDYCSGPVAAHIYENTTIKLAAADPAFKNTLRLNQATGTPLTTSDGGKTWTVQKIEIKQYSFTKVMKREEFSHPQIRAAELLSASSANSSASLPDDSLYACQTSNDCAIRDQGSCCGYKPVCANRDATFTKPNCAGGRMEICGFREPPSCKCVENRCG